MEISICKEENYDGEIYGDLEKEFQINLENREKLAKDYGDIIDINKMFKIIMINYIYFIVF